MVQIQKLTPKMKLIKWREVMEIRKKRHYYSWKRLQKLQVYHDITHSLTQSYHLADIDYYFLWARHQSLHASMRCKILYKVMGFGWVHPMGFICLQGVMGGLTHSSVFFMTVHYNNCVIVLNYSFIEYQVWRINISPWINIRPIQDHLLMKTLLRNIIWAYQSAIECISL